MAANGLSMDLGSAMDVDVSDLDVSVGNALNGMDGQMPLTDLFGDPLDIQEMPRAAASKQLQQRLDELRTRGCCQGIAWSKQGTIASISKDGRSIDLRFLRAHPDNGSWQLSQPTPWNMPGTLDGCPIVHLAWAGTSSPELAVIDSVGRVFVLTFSITLNHPYPARKWNHDSHDGLHAVVGCYWLPLPSPPHKPYQVLFSSAVREGNTYKYENVVVPGSLPWHPNPGKSALLCVTTSGVLKLFFSHNSNKMEESTVELENIDLSDDRITHASLTSDRSKSQHHVLLIAMATASKRLKVVRVRMERGTQPPADKQVPPASQPLIPIMKVKHVAMTSWFEHGPTESRLDTSMAQLSHIQVLPEAPEGPPTPSVQWSPALVLTVRSYVAGENTAYSQEQQSIIDRWELRERQQKLHSMFEQLSIGSGRSGNPLPTVTQLHKLEPIILPKIVISIHVMQLGKVICFAFSDGTVQYRDRLTMNEIYNDLNVERFMIPTQVGFQFAEEKPCLQVAFSPTNCSLVQICEDEKVLWNSMKFPVEAMDSTIQDKSQYTAVVAALSIAMSNTTMPQQTNCDDVLALARPFAERRDRFPYEWIMELVRMLKLTVDYSADAKNSDNLVRNNNLHLCFAILNHLGFRGEFKPRTFGGKFAMLALNIRNIVILISIASTSTTPKHLPSLLDEEEVVNSLSGCVKWTLDFFSWLTDCLFNLLDEPDFTAILNDPRRFNELTRYLQSKNNVALHLLLCSSTRSLASAVSKRVAHLERVSREYFLRYEASAHTHTASNPTRAATRMSLSLYQAYQKLHRFTSASLVKVDDINQLLETLAAEIRTAYETNLPGITPSQLRAHREAKNKRQQGGDAAANQQQNTPLENSIDRAKTHCELSLLLATAPPPNLHAVVLNFFNKHLREYRAQVDPAKLFFADYSLLEIEDDEATLRRRRLPPRPYVDVFKRCVLSAERRLAQAEEEGVEDPQWRRCARCTAVMGDIYSLHAGYTFVVGQQRKCSCGGCWGMLEKGKMVS